MGYREVPGIGSIDIENVEWRRMRIGDRVYEYPRPYEISIEVTHNCPAYCLMCSSNSRCVWREGRLEGELLSVEIIQLLGAAKALGAEVVSWSGGEPLIRHDMPVIMAGAAALGFRQWLYTSGVVWDTENRGGAAPIPPSLVEEVVRRCERVMIDIQHPDPYMNDVIMGVPGISEMQQESIRLLQEHGVRWLEAQVVPMKVNWRDFPDLVQLLLDRMEFNRVSFLRFVPQGRGEQLKRWLYLTPGEMLELNKMLRRLQREYGEDRVRIGRPLNFCFLFDDDCTPARCRAAFDAPLIQPLGRVDACFSGDTEVLVAIQNKRYKLTEKYEIRRMKFRDLYKMRDYKMKVFHNGKWKQAKVISVDARDKKFVRVYLRNGFVVTMTEDHICLVKPNPDHNRRPPMVYKRAIELEVGDYLPFNLTPIEGRGGTYELGFFVGLYVAEGSHFETFHFGIDERDLAEFVAEYGEKYLGSRAKIHVDEEHHGITVTFRGDSEAVRGVLQSFVEGTNAKTKRLKPKVLEMSIDFRRGLIDGIFAGDGYRPNEKGKNTEVELASSGLIQDISAVLVSLGIPHSIRYGKDGLPHIIKISDNPNEKERLRGRCGRYTYPYWDDRYAWTRIDKIEIIEEDERDEHGRYTSVRKPKKAYCFVIEDDEDKLFILANGLVTHNCPAWKKMPDRVALGNVHDRGLIWSWVASPVAREIRSFVGAPIEEIRERFKGRCVKCPYFEKCRAKCTAQRMLAYNFDWYQTPDPQCPLVRA